MTRQPDRNWGCRISDEHAFRGMRVLVMENETLRISVLLDKGTDVYEFLYKPLDVDFMWRGPNPLRDPRTFIPNGPRGEAGVFQDFYFGGWQEILPNGGAPTVYKGAHLGQHGEVSTVPWNCRIARDDPEEVAAKVWTRTHRTPFLIEKTLRLKKGRSVLFIEEKLTNEGEEPMEFMWGHHPALGEPFLDETCRIDVPASRVEIQSPRFCENSRLPEGRTFDAWPLIEDREGKPFDLSRIPPRDARTSEMCYLLDLADGWHSVTSGRLKAGFAMRWDRRLFKALWLWEVFGGNYGHPWYGRTYNIALEPWTSHPGGLANALARGTAARLAPGESIETTLLAVAHQGFERVTGVSDQGEVEGT